jgi:cytochrome c-type biogenesis protein CcmE
MGGLVVPGSFKREEGSLSVEFVLTDGGASIRVKYTGLLPDLFKEGQGIITRGRINASGVFSAIEVLAKHDENYMPPKIQPLTEQA